MEILHITTKKGGMFYTGDADNTSSQLVYNIALKDKMIIEHTEVTEILEGKGIGKQLVNAAVDYARKNKMKILPLCPFAKTILSASDKYKDVLV